ncbi:MAG: hypothetical protein AAGA90_02435 [Actinomycetota bacterium]
MLRDAHRRGRVQEGVAIVLALIVLVATFTVAATSVAGGTVPPASRTGEVGFVPVGDDSERCDQSITITVVADGATATDRICSFGQVHPARSG